MPETTVDVEALYAALDQKRQATGVSWRDVARLLKVSASTFTRMAQGKRPDVDTFATLLRWLGMSADDFMRPPRRRKEEPQPLAMISAYLRGARTIHPKDAKALEDILQAAYRRLTTKR